MAKAKNNIKDVQQRLKQKILAVNAAISDVSFSALQTGMALMKRRIFNEGRDSKGKLFGGYISDPYKRKRLRAGRQIAKKDLQFTGDLFIGIQTFKKGKFGSEIRFTTQSLADIAGYQEQQIANIRTGILTGGKKKKTKKRKAPPLEIFVLSTKEQKEVTRVGKELLKQIITT